MRYLVVGQGSIGRRHLSNLRRLEPDAHITVCYLNRSPSLAGGTAPEADLEIFGLPEIFNRSFDAAVIAAAAPEHISIGRALSARGIHLLLEKPLSDGLEGTRSLIHECDAGRVVLLVGYTLRFNPVLRALYQSVQRGAIGRILWARAEVGQYLPSWRPGRDWRDTVSARRDNGGGALLELSHEIDTLCWFLGTARSVSSTLRTLGDFGLDIEDSVDLTLDFSAGTSSKGPVAHAHMDMLQQPASRSLKLAGTEGTAVWDGTAGTARIWTTESGTWNDINPEITVDHTDPYLLEMEHFLECVRGDAVPYVTGEEARHVLAIAVAARRSDALGRSVLIDEVEGL